jgi:hypothetical protein
VSRWSIASKTTRGRRHHVSETPAGEVQTTGQGRQRRVARGDAAVQPEDRHAERVVVERPTEALLALDEVAEEEGVVDGDGGQVGEPVDEELLPPARAVGVWVVDGEGPDRQSVAALDRGGPAAPQPGRSRGVAEVDPPRVRADVGGDDRGVERRGRPAGAGAVSDRHPVDRGDVLLGQGGCRAVVQGPVLAVEEEDRAPGSRHQALERGEDPRQHVGQRGGAGDELEHLDLPVQHLARLDGTELDPHVRQRGRAHESSVSW